MGPLPPVDLAVLGLVLVAVGVGIVVAGFVLAVVALVATDRG